MFNCFKQKKKPNSKEFARKLSNIVILGLEKYDEEQQKELNNIRWSKIRSTFKTINIIKNN